MKKLALSLLLVMTLAACKSKKVVVEEEKPAAPRISVLAPAEINSAEKTKAYSLGKRVLETCNTSRFKPFTTAEATQTVIKNTTQERLTRTCQKFRIKYGKFEDIRLVEVLHDREANTNIYRYKADYQWKHTQKELRVIMNSDNKVSAIQSRDWKDTFTP
jgi:uncharacterized lipoprotein